MLPPTKKAWGESQALFRNEQVEFVRILTVAGGQSSIHFHQWKDNIFQVLRGKLQVMLYHADYIETIQLDATSPPLCVPAGLQHRFQALEDSEAYEIYVATTADPIDPNDIVRLPAESVAAC